MAKFLSQLVTQASGSQGGTTYSHNRGGMYMRARSKPSKPRTAAQIAITDAVSQIAPAWANLLSQSQRDGWILYGQTNPTVDTLGRVQVLAGINMFIRLNTALVAGFGGGALVQDSPGATPFLGALTFDTDVAETSGTIAGTLINAVEFEIDDYIFIYATRSCSTGATPAHQPYKIGIAVKLVAQPTVHTEYPFTFSDPFLSTRIQDSPIRLRAMWIRGGNMSPNAYVDIAADV